jgi:hypothetical protein
MSPIRLAASASVAPLFHAIHCLLLLAFAGTTVAAGPRSPNSLDLTQGWSAIAAQGAKVTTRPESGKQGATLRIDFDFRAGGGEVTVHKAFPQTLPENFALRYRVRGQGAVSLLELRLVDASGQNVWNYRSPTPGLPLDSEARRVKRRQFEFAWGPAGGGQPAQLGMVEFVINRVEGGRGTLWIDDLQLEPLPPAQPYAATPILSASSTRPDGKADTLLDEHPAKTWHSAAGSQPQWLILDFRHSREYGGLLIDWDQEDYATAYTIELSDDGRQWRRAYVARQGNGGRDYVPLPEAESRYLRLRMTHSSHGQGFGLRHLEVAPLDFAKSANRLFERIAKESPRGYYPRYFTGEQTFWTMVGSPGTEQRGAQCEGLLNEDGLLESDGGAFSIEPFLWTNDKLHSWADGNASVSLDQDYLPIPSVQWERGPLLLTVTALATDTAGGCRMMARYRVQNRGQDWIKTSLFLTIRPFQVNPPWQSMHDDSGVVRIHRLRYEPGLLRVNYDRSVMPLTRPDEVGVAGFDGDPIVGDMAQNKLPNAISAIDANGYASAAFRYSLKLKPGEVRDIALAIPPKAAGAKAGRPARSGNGTDEWNRHYAEARHLWEAQLDRVKLTLPPAEASLAQALKSNLAFLLIHRNGPALRPGSRRYGRIWIRDGALASATLLAFGHVTEGREFLRWYAGYQKPDGSVPCCLDVWGPDFMIEHDAAGEFIYSVANDYCYTRELPFLMEMWPKVAKAADYLESLRGQRLAPKYTTGDDARLYGLVPESASHEGYVAHPVHSYWDDFWSVRGFDDAALLAAAVGDQGRVERYARLGRDMRANLRQSIALTQKMFGNDYTPASAELGDFDPTSTAIALVLGGEADGPLEPSLRRTFLRFDAEIQDRIKGASNWQAYAPYELRNVSALVRLGERDAAIRALRFLFAGRIPAAWNQWPEVVWRNPRLPRFIGDMPHAWIGAEFMQALLSLFVYEGDDHRPVLGGGLPQEWIEAPGGVGIAGLRTAYGTLSYRVEATPQGETRMHIDAGMTLPQGGLTVDLPLRHSPAQVTVNGREQAVTGSRIRIDQVPADIVIR